MTSSACNGRLWTLLLSRNSIRHSLSFQLHHHQPLPQRIIQFSPPLMRMPRQMMQQAMALSSSNKKGQKRSGVELLKALRDGKDIDMEERDADSDDKAYQSIVRSWLERLVIGLKLCPWASPALNAGAIQIIIHRGEDLEDLAQTVLTQVTALAEMSEDSPRNATVLIAAPDTLHEFEDFLDFNGLLDDSIDDVDARGKVQLASFHPHYQFADSAGEDDVENYTNRSPFPIFHLLREIEVSRALEGYVGDPSKIYERNKAVMRDQGKEALQSLIKSCSNQSADGAAKEGKK